jgi:hypothetical protein
MAVCVITAVKSAPDSASGVTRREIVVRIVGSRTRESGIPCLYRLHTPSGAPRGAAACSSS